MIEAGVVRQVRELTAAGWGSRSIADELGIDRKTVMRARCGPVGRTQTRPQARCLSAEAVTLAVELFTGAARGNAVVVTTMLLERGHAASVRTVQRAVSSSRRELRAAQAAAVRFETAPGAQLQVDFGEQRLEIGGIFVVVHLLVAVLAFSRRLFVKAFTSERAEDWREGIGSAFRHFGGVTREVLVDNARALVKSRDVVVGTVEFHPGLVMLCRDFGCIPRACAPYRARTKGKVESGVKYVKHNALAGRSFTTISALEEYLSSWMKLADERVHGTTHETPLARFLRAEAAALTPLPSSAIRTRERRLQRKVSSDSFIDVDTVRYSVPHTLVHETVSVDVGEQRVRVYRDAALVADHRRVREPYAVVVEPEHHVALWRAARLHVASMPTSFDRPLTAYANAIGGVR
jgi:transposase